jgi:hypothetical protein
MKKLIFIVATLFATTTQGQLSIIRHQDEMTDKVYYFPSEGIVIKSSDGESGFRVRLSIKEKNDALQQDGLTIKAVNIGSCYENNKLTMLFENGEKFTIVSWNKFNCDGDVYFEVSNKNWELLKSQKLVKMRFENGRTYDSLTGEVETQDYFIVYNNLMNEKKYENDAK